MENCLSLEDLHQLLDPKSEISDYNFFYIPITSLGYLKSCCPSTTKLKFDFPKYTMDNHVNFKRKFFVEVFTMNKMLGILGAGIGGYDAFTWHGNILIR